MISICKAAYVIENIILLVVCVLVFLVFSLNGARVWIDACGLCSQRVLILELQNKWVCELRSKTISKCCSELLQV